MEIDLLKSKDLIIPEKKNVHPDLDSTAKRISNHALFFTTFFARILLVCV
jgi:hypothetical protein